VGRRSHDGRSQKFHPLDHQFGEETRDWRNSPSGHVRRSCIIFDFNQDHGMTWTPHAPLTREETLLSVRAGDLDALECTFDAQWYDLPDQFADEVMRMLGDVPPDVLERRPRLTHLALLAQRRQAYARGDDDAVSRSFQLYVRAGLRSVRRLDRLSRLPDTLCAGTAAVVAHRSRRDYASSERVGAWLDARAQDAPHAALPWAAIRPAARPGWLSAQRGITAMLSGADDAAATLFSRAAEEAGDRPSAHYARVTATAHLALLGAYRGHHRLAWRHLERLADEPPFPDWVASAHMGADALASAQLAIDEGDPETARAILAEYEALAPHRPDLWAFHAHVLACYHAHYGDPLRGLREIDELRLLHGVVGRESDTFLGRVALRGEAKLLVRAGGAGRVLQLAHEHDPNDEWLSTHHAWAHLVLGETVEAISLASSALRRAPLSPNDALGLHVVNAVAHLRAGREDKARTWFQRALRLRATPRQVAPFLGMRPEERETLERLAGVSSLLPGGSTVVDHNVLGVALAERLSPRERVVLEALCEGCTAEQAAERFSVSINTVRTQIRHIYRKLGVTSRREAVAAARELGLVAA